MKITLTREDVGQAITYWLREGRLAKDPGGAYLWEIVVGDGYDEDGSPRWLAEVTLKDVEP